LLLLLTWGIAPHGGWASSELIFPPIAPNKRSSVNERVRERLMAYLDESKVFELVDKEIALPMLVSDEDEGDTSVLEKARDLVRQGRESYENVQFSAALQMLREAAGLYEENLRHLRTRSDYLECLVFLGLSYLGLEDKVNAQVAFTKAVVINPETSLDPNLYPPKVVAFFEELKKQLRGREPGILKITVEDLEQFTVYIDGERSESFVRGLLPGEHIIVVESAGYVPHAEVATIKSGRNTLELVLKKRSTAKLYKNFMPFKGKLSVQRGDFLAEFHKLNRVRLVLLAAVERMEKNDVAVTLQLYDAKHAEASEPISATYRMGGDETPLVLLIKQLEGCLDGDYVLQVCRELKLKGPKGADAHTGMPLVEEVRPPLWERTWFLVTASIVGGATVVGLVLLWAFSGKKEETGTDRCPANSDDPYCVVQDTQIEDGVIEINVPAP